MGAGASSPALSHRSLNCRDATTVEFINTTDQTVTTTWLDYRGAPRVYAVLAPGERVRQLTFTAHPWIFVAEDPHAQPCVVDDQLVYYPPLAPEGSAPVQALICPASPLPWSQAHHLCFPPDFRAGAAALLCCHRRLSAPPHAGQQQLGKWRQPWRQHLAWLRRLCPAAHACYMQLGADAEPAARGLAAQDAAAAATRDQGYNLGDLPKVGKCAERVANILLHQLLKSEA